ncbi:uncharacterized protein LTR77_001433 [Saxophila tyrrhenica]|uniref:2EXR domain-containing protein n=1 Tax=Saxophila tyrrhenica TaxID=1690608 RepID=A0AAV9PMR5_9PEZI|nr:hypothetical protein LTR77_001433 [Saxophila tyrrhenica]
MTSYYSEQAISNEPTNLFTLPAELRIYIYELVLALPNGHIIHVTDVIRTRRHRRRITPVTQPPVTRTCRQLRLETLPIFYASAPFYLGKFSSQTDFEKPNDAVAFLDAIGTEGRGTIKRLLIGWGAEDAQDLVQELMWDMFRTEVGLVRARFKEQVLVAASMRERHERFVWYGRRFRYGLYEVSFGV